MQFDTSHESQSTLVIRDNEDDIDLWPFFLQVYRARKFILVGVSIIVTIALLANEFFGKYWSEGHFKIGNISQAAYKDFLPILMNVDLFRVYAVKEGVTNKESIAFIEGLISSPSEQLDQYVSIAKSMSSKDDKENISAKGKMNEPEVDSSFSVMNLKMPGPSPEAAQLRSRLFSEYFADTYIYVNLLRWLDSVKSDLEAAAYSDKLEAIEIQHNIDEANMRLVALRSLTRRVPEALRVESCQLISVEVQNDMSDAPKSGGGKDGRRRIQGGKFERFLSPVAQIVAAESMILDGKIDLLRLQHKQKQGDLAHEFYKQAAAIGEATSSGREFIDKLIAVKDVFSRTMSKNDAGNLEVVNGIFHELEQHQLRYASDFKFLSNPTLPKGKVKKSLLFIIFGAGAGGMFFMIALTLLMSWVQKNTEPLTDDTGSTAIAA